MEKEFKDIGKKMPYSIPDGFFETITTVTLEKARRRERADRKRRVYFQWLAAAAVLTGIVFTSLRLLNPPEEVVSPMVAGTPLETPAQEGIIKPDSGSLTINVGSAVLEKRASRESVEFVKSVDNEESLDELLASIPDEELLEWATLLNNDPFSEETENDANHEDN
jgi:hypothetical protein